MNDARDWAAIEVTFDRKWDVIGLIATQSHI